MKTPFEADVLRLGYVGRQPGARRSDDWYTPSVYVEAARRVLGGIELDPCSSAHANLTIKAKRYFTESDDAFTKTWEAKTLWLNPPYSGKLCRAAIEMLVNQFEAGRFTSAIVLVNNATETRAGQLLLHTARAVCFTNHRISFLANDGKNVSGNTRGQCFYLLSKKPSIALFRREFSQFGAVLSCK